MTKTIKFTKMHGAGNDYIYVNTLAYDIPVPNAAAKEWSHRHTGIGSDGLVLIGKPTTEEADYRMRIFNADGSEAMMCGNASRCIGKYLYEKEFTKKTNIRLQTASGIKILNLHLTANKLHVASVTVDMLEPHLDVPQQFTGTTPDLSTYNLPLADSKQIRPTFVSMGNPHFVVFLDKNKIKSKTLSLTDEELTTIGKELEHNAAFPERCNIEFACLTADNHLRTRVWERGSGITMACGTGACATATAAIVNHLADRSKPVEIEMDGGTLTIEWRNDNHIYMSGPAEFAFEGEILLQQ